jgi:hypothetical protein
MQKDTKTPVQNALAKLDKKLVNDPVAMQVAASGKPRISRLDAKWMFTRLYETNDINTTTISSKKEIDCEKFISKLESAGWELIGSDSYHSIAEGKTKPKLLIYAKEPGFVIDFSIDYRSQNENQKNVGGGYNFPLEAIWEGEISYVSAIEVYHFLRSLPEFDETIYEEIITFVKESMRDDEKGAEIGIISSSSGDYYVKNFSLEGKTPEFTHPDLHYGDGFQDFHNNLLEKLKKTTKGLVLLHGDPGTGKTQYIRVLLKELAKINKSILYAPPSLSASLTEPEIIEFISDWIIGEERDCILLIEDAEPLLEIRAGADGRSTGISNLLNMTDGLLNDILGLTVIATFNTTLSKIDPALLRPQRLLARKEFKKMPKDMMKKLADALEIPLPDITYPASLAEFYSVKNENEILIHNIQEETGIGFNARR